MATALTPQELSAAGNVAAGSGVSEAVADITGNTFPNDGRMVLQARNTSGGSLNVTLTTPATLDSGRVTLSDPVIAVAAGVTKLIGPLDPNVYGGSVTATASTTGISFIVWHLP